MENYIYELYKNNGITKLEERIENISGKLLKASVSMRPSQTELLIVITDRRFHFIKAYQATDYGCKSEEQCFLSFGYDKLPKSEKGYCNDEDFRKFYLRFMAEQFPTYEDDYYEHINNEARKDLGKTN